jgi:N-(2-amino-2-carboxyethyl)-L-glutamate synthase
MKNGILSVIGNTPLVALNKLFPDTKVYAKLEMQNPGGSSKDRTAVLMLSNAIKGQDCKKQYHNRVKFG